jgi:DMSO/TMAO reductase YedYZ molybdopterin-dependent catalytic subunit
VGGLVRRPRTLTLAALHALPRRTVEFTLECSGNTGPPFFIGGVGNARWTGTPLHLLLQQAGPDPDATEVVFWGADRGTVTIRDNSGIVAAGDTGTAVPDDGGGLDLTVTEQPVHGPRLRHRARAAACRADGLDVPHRLARPAQVGAGQGGPPG